MDYQITPADGNVFQDIGFPPGEARSLKIRSVLMLTAKQFELWLAMQTAHDHWRGGARRGRAPGGGACGAGGVTGKPVEVRTAGTVA